MKALNIRWKLTLWYGCVLGVVLVVFGASVYFVLRHQLIEGIDEGLHEELADVLAEVKRHPNEAALRNWLDHRFAHHEGFDFQITKADGSHFFLNERLAAADLQFPAGPSAPPNPQYSTVRVNSNGRWRILTASSDSPVGVLTIKIARSLAAFDHEIEELLLTFLFTGPMTLAVAMAGGYFLAQRALEPVYRITQTAKHITAEHLSQRIHVANPQDELGELADTLNQMIERLENSFTEMQRFTADAAHELRTPLAVLRNEAEVALRSPRSPDEYSAVLENLLEEINRFSKLADQLLFLSRQDAGLQSPAQEAVRMDFLMRDVVGNMELLAHEKQISLSLSHNDCGEVLGDAGQLRRVFYNVLDNAIKYTRHGGMVTIESRTRNAEMTIAIVDNGIGIPAEHLPHIFERFYCVDPARSGETNGVGLGLAICQSIIRRLRGSIKVDSNANVGTRVTISLPLFAE